MLQALFSHSSGLISHQKDEQAGVLLKQILKRIQAQMKFYDDIILDVEEKSLLKQQYPFFQKTTFITFCKYGCAIVLFKEKSFLPIKITLVFPKAWDFGVSLNQGNVLYYADQPKSVDTIQLGKVQHQSLQIYTVILLQEIKLQLQNQEKLRQKKYKNSDRRNHHTPSFLLEVAKYSLASSQKAKQETKQASGKQKKEEQLEQIFSKGGTMDVGIHTGTTPPNTEMPIILGCIEYVLQSSVLPKFILLELRIHYLKQAVNKFEYSLSVYKLYQKCLEQLVVYFKSLVNQGLEFDQQKIARQIISISQQVHSAYIPSSTDKVQLDQLSANIQKLSYNRYSYFYPNA